jgi:hypothetical protein
MSQLTNFLKTRIEELTTSVEAQTTEMAAYARVLEIELAKEKAPSEESVSKAPVKTTPVSTHSAPSVDLPFTGNKTAFVIAVVQARGAAGATPKEIREVFSARKIALSENLIYTTLSALAKQKKLQRRDGRYYGAVNGTAPKTVTTKPAKRKISPEGLKRIREANKKRWAAKKAADRAAAK